ncbi:MAG: sulfatase-like hydrolase/transferase [Planctomycetota bacterium]|jgi:lipid A ethanolaminephosphotransferase|nr:sulfatase-like hydrolase/transferase [Planctomycetota bacterium]
MKDGGAAKGFWRSFGVWALSCLILWFLSAYIGGVIVPGDSKPFFAFLETVRYNPSLLWLNLLILMGTGLLISFRRWYISLPVFLFHFLTLSFIFIYLQINGVAPNAFDLFVVLDGLGDLSGMVKEVLFFFGKQLALGGIGAFVVCFGLQEVLGKRLAHYRGNLLCAVFLPLHFLSIWHLFFHASPLVCLYSPIYVRVPAFYAMYEKIERMLYTGKRDAPLLKPGDYSGAPKHIVMIMDESVCGRVLSINGFNQPTTPFLENRDELINYGSASSSTNASSSSNIILLSGLQMRDLPDVGQLGLRRALLTDYARLAGRKAYYMDCQNARLQNYLRFRDMSSFVYLHYAVNKGIIEEWKRDSQGLSDYAALIAESPEPTFTFFLKTGCHFDYEDKYNPDADYDEIATAGNIPETYLRSVRWAVDEFFRELQERLNGEDVLIVYTSDHGQSFVGGILPHTVIDNPPAEQADVPLFIWPLSKNAREWVNAKGGFVSENRDQATHFQVFPSLLILMGYDADEVHNLFGASLFGLPPKERFFLSGFVFGELKSGLTNINRFIHQREPINLNDGQDVKGLEIQKAAG